MFSEDKEVWLRIFCAVVMKEGSIIDARMLAESGLQLFKDRFPEPKEIGYRENDD